MALDCIFSNVQILLSALGAAEQGGVAASWCRGMASRSPAEIAARSVEQAGDAPLLQALPGTAGRSAQADSASRAGQQALQSSLHTAAAAAGLTPCQI